MTEQAAAAAAQAGTEVKANAAPVAGTAAVTAPEWASGLQDAGNREYIGSKGYKDLDAVITSTRHGDKVQSELADLKAKALTPPGPDAKQEDWDAFYGKLGRPEKPEAYEFKLPEGLPENFPYDGESATKFKAWAHSQGLTPKQAQGLHDSFVKGQAEQFAAITVSQTAKGDQAHAELVKVWGAKGTAPYTENVQHADRFIANNGGDGLLAELKGAGLMSPEGVVLSPVLAQAMAKAGKALYREGEFVEGGKQPGGVNPFDSKTPNITEQMRMFRSNPDLARSYIRAAGKQPGDFGLT